MKIIRTPLHWNSAPDASSSGWLHSFDYIETADITVDELNSGTRTGTVAFTQDESGDQEEVTVIQKRVTTYYYSVGTNAGDGTQFRIDGQVEASNNGVATRESGPNDAAPDTMTATPEDDIRALTVSKPSVTFDYEADSTQETFTWKYWDKDEVTLSRSIDTIPQEFINSASTTIPTVGSVIVSDPNWLSAQTNGRISVSRNTGDVRSGTVQYTNHGKTATVTVTQAERPVYMKFGVQTTSTLAIGKQVTFTVDGGESTTKTFEAKQSDSGTYYVAYIEALAGTIVYASCDASYAMIATSENSLDFNPSGEYKDVTITAQTISIHKDHSSPLNGCANLTNLDVINEITRECNYGGSVTDENFSLSYPTSTTARITAAPNETESARTGTATFALDDDHSISATVALNQEHVPWFSFNSTISGSPNSGQVTFYNSSIPNPSHFIASGAYIDNGDDTQSVSWSGTVNGNPRVISYKVEGFEPSSYISANPTSVTFNKITMASSGTGVNKKYYLSGATKDVTVDAHNVSYEYEINGTSKPLQVLTGQINANSEVIFNATATTTNKFTITPASANFWSYNITAETSSGTTVKVEAKPLIPVLSNKSLTLVYTLSGSDKTAQTTFTIPSGATSGIGLQNFALSSSTKFGEDSYAGRIPTGSSAYTFAFVPPTRSSRTNVSGMNDVHYAALRYIESDGEGNLDSNGEIGWMLFYPYTSNDTGGSSKLPEYTAKVYIITYGDGQTGSGKNDIWTLGPLVYRTSSSDTYHEVVGFEFLTRSLLTNSKTGVEMCQINPNSNGRSTTYPSVCPFSGNNTPPLSATSNYFNLCQDTLHGHTADTSASSGSIISEGKRWVLSGKAQGGLPPSVVYSYTPPSFVARTDPMRKRTYYFRYLPGNNSCDGSDIHYNSARAMPHAFSGALQTNLFDNIRIKVVYYGRYANQDPDVPSTATTWHVPADSYTVSPITPGDTSSVVYDAETNSYIIYNINNVVVVQIANHTVVPPEDLEDYKTPIEGGIIEPIGP